MQVGPTIQRGKCKVWFLSLLKSEKWIKLAAVYTAEWFVLNETFSYLQNPWFIIENEFKSRAGYNGARTVLIYWFSHIKSCMPYLICVGTNIHSEVINFLWYIPPIYLHLIFDILKFEISSLINWIFFPNLNWILAGYTAQVVKQGKLEISN